MSKMFFTSDWHLGDHRIGINGGLDLMRRPFKSVLEQDNTIIDNLISSDFKDGDTLINLGDVVYDKNDPYIFTLLGKIKKFFPNSKFVLVIGNYDEGFLTELGMFFDEIVHEMTVKIDNQEFYLNHYPTNCIDDERFCLTGHIHGLWRIQKNMLNVGVDVHHFYPLSEEDVMFYFNAIKTHFHNDSNVFPYSLFK
jgi:calcineurin-like phosphoesterase family protein